MEWKTTGSANAASITPTILGSDDAIATASKGQIKITATNVVVNCPIVQWGGNKDNTNTSRSYMKKYHHRCRIATADSLFVTYFQYFLIKQEVN